MFFDKKEKYKLAIIIPAYNEAQTIKAVLTQFHNEYPEADFFVIDNNSVDSTSKIAAETLEELKANGSIIFEPRKGKANAVRRAFIEIKADVYVLVDADLTYFANDLAALIEPIVTNKADLVVGDRLSKGDYHKENKRRFHGFGNNLVKFLINFLFRTKLNDIMSGYRVFNNFFVKNFSILSEGFELETEMTLFALDKKFRIKEIPINYQDRPCGSESKLNTFSDGFKVIKAIILIFKDYKPFVFFSFLSFAFLLIGFLIGFPVIIEFINTDYITKVPSAILASGLMILSFLSFSIALILDTVVKHNRIYYELNLLKTYHQK
ncbi:MAG: glycosyltransferase family 2 protein [Candidatus Margulisiibacteriota bacterium]|jgi:glycosyltransferase involved in cell wall biosynthesis